MIDDRITKQIVNVVKKKLRKNKLDKMQSRSFGAFME